MAIDYVGVSSRERKNSAAHLLARDLKLKIWVPESVYTALTLLADAMEVSRPEWVRYALITHAFGRLRLGQALLEVREAPRRMTWRRWRSAKIPIFLR
ncbi:MAG TPA: hypothetical protein VFN13_06040 [Rudaea sp.]|nr:hypothetical protein [Rudaea sp.]